MSKYRICRGSVAAILVALAGTRGIGLPAAHANSENPQQDESSIRTLTPQPEQSAAELLAFLRSQAKDKTADADRALRAGLEFCLALGVGDGRAAVRSLDAVGYQPLPLSGELPLDPPRSIPAEELARWIDRRADSNVAAAAARHFVLRSRAECESLFPAVAAWMLPDDHALVLESPGARVHYWIERRACLVIRVRGKRPAIVGGNLIEVLLASDETAEPQP